MDTKGWLTRYGLLVNQAMTALARNGCNLVKRFQATLRDCQPCIIRTWNLVLL